MSLWTLGFIAGFLIVLVVAALLIGILLQARRILGLAKVAAEVVAEIDLNTRSVWALTKTNQVAGQILDGARAIDANASAIVGAVSHSNKSKAA